LNDQLEATIKAKRNLELIIFINRENSSLKLPDSCDLLLPFATLPLSHPRRNFPSFIAW
jgi:hypothetical protein